VISYDLNDLKNVQNLCLFDILVTMTSVCHDTAARQLLMVKTLVKKTFLKVCTRSCVELITVVSVVNSTLSHWLTTTFTLKTDL